MPTSATLDQSLSVRVSGSDGPGRTVAVVDELSPGEVDEGCGDARRRVEDTEQPIAELDGFSQVELIVAGQIVCR